MAASWSGSRSAGSARSSWRWCWCRSANDIDNANLALLLVLVVVLAAIVGDRAAAVRRGDHRDDGVRLLPDPSVHRRCGSRAPTTSRPSIILLAVGLLVGEVARARPSLSAERERAGRRDRAGAPGRGAASPRAAALDPDRGSTRRRTRSSAELKALLRLHDCRLEFAPFQWPLPRLERSGTIEASEHE